MMKNKRKMCLSRREEKRGESAHKHKHKKKKNRV